MKKGMILLFGILVAIFFLRASYAENLKLSINGYINDYTSDVELKTHENASLDLDSFDSLSIPPPSNYSEFYSNISSGGTEYHLAVDAWNSTSTPRTLYLVYYVSEIQAGNISFEWQQLLGNFSGTFSYYGDDASYSDLLATLNMSNESYYSYLAADNFTFYVSVTIENLLVDTNPPDINFGNPTPSDGSSQANNDIYVNVSASDEGNVSTFIDFDNSLVAWWRMDDANTTDVYDYLGINNGSIVGATSTDDGVLGDGFEFDGDNDYMSISYFEFDSGNFTISFWARPYNVSTGSSPAYNPFAHASSGDEQGIYFYQNWNQMYFYVYNSSGANSIYSSIAGSVNTWKHYVGRKDGDNFTLWFDGVFVADKVVPNYQPTDTELAYIGAYASATANWWGTIDDVIIFNRTLSDTEIANLYANQSSTFLENNFTDLSDGSHAFEAYAQDTGGNVNSTETRTVTVSAVDTITPGVYIESPANTTYNINIIDFNVSANEDLSYCNFTIDGANWFDMEMFNVTYANFTNNTMADGQYYANFTCNDTAGNVNDTEFIVFVVDMPAPNVTLNTPENGSATNSILDTILNWTISDYNGDEMEVWVYGGNDSTNLETNLLYHITGLPDGEYFYNWSAQIVQPDSSTVVLLHFDNRSEYGESDIFAYDFSSFGNNASIDDAVWNSTGMFAGAYEFEGMPGNKNITVDGNNVESLLLRNFTIAMWFLKRGGGDEAGFTTCTSSVLTSKGLGGGDTSGIDANWVLGVNESSGNLVGCFEGPTGTDYIINTGTTVIQEDVWYHVALVLNYTELAIYVNGVLESVLTVNSDAAVNNISIGVGGGRGGAAATNNDGQFNGSIDDFAIWNRPLYASEIAELYNLTAQKYYWRVNVTDSAKYNQSEIYEFTIQAGNSAPSTPTVSINSTDENLNDTMQNLTCNATLDDADGNTMNVTVEWYNDSVVALTLDYNNSYSSGTLFMAELDAGNTTKNENWSCSLRLYDGVSYSDLNYSSNLTIRNTAPSVSLLDPVEGSMITNRTPEFNWTGSDLDGDTLNYILDIVCWYAGVPVSIAEKYKSVGTATSYIPPVGDYLTCLADNLQNYTWNVTVNDGEESNNTAENNLSVQSSVTISLPVDTINFGNMKPSDSNYTTNDVPPPFVVQNDGNCEVNISINASDLFSTSANPTNNYLYQIRDTTASFSCYAVEGTYLTNWFLMQAVSNISINRLNFTSGYQTGCNNASVDINITVPEKEPGGEFENKTSIVTFQADLAEPRVPS